MERRFQFAMIGVCLVTLVVMGTAYALGETGAYWWPRLVVTVGSLGLLSWGRLAALVRERASG